MLQVSVPPWLIKQNQAVPMSRESTPELPHEEEEPRSLPARPEHKRTGVSLSTTTPRKRLRPTIASYPAILFDMEFTRGKWVHSGLHTYKVTSNSNDLERCPLCANCFLEFMRTLDVAPEMKLGTIVLSPTPRFKEHSKNSETSEQAVKEPEMTSDPGVVEGIRKGCPSHGNHR